MSVDNPKGSVRKKNSMIQKRDRSKVQSNPLIKYILLFWLATNIMTDLKVENCGNLTFIMVETKLETWICT